MKILETSSIRGSTLLAALGTTFVLAAAASWWIYRKKKPRGKWRRVGDLSTLWCYPIKSGGAINLIEADCVDLGIKTGLIRDRVFMVTGLEGNFKSAGTYPHMTQIATSIEGEDLVLKAPGMPTISLSIHNILNEKKNTTGFWNQTDPVLDCGDEIASWLSKYILQEEKGCRLVIWIEGSLPDDASFMILNKASVDDLNLKLPSETKPSTALQFRPNFVVSGNGLKPYEEDFWKWVRIGEKAVFECVRPCTRCVTTTIDPDTGIRDKSMEPLKTLKKYRQVTDPKLRETEGDSPMQGIYLELRRTGKVQVGDPIYVIE